MICKNCGKENNENNTVCSRCLEPLQSEEKVLSQESADIVMSNNDEAQPEKLVLKKEPAKYIVCKNCNAKNPTSYMNCRLCGSKIQKKSKEKPSKNKIILLSVIGALVLIILAVSFFYVVPMNKMEKQIIEKTFSSDENNEFLTMVEKYVEIDVTGYSAGKRVIVEVTSADISEEFVDSYGFVNNSVIEEMIKADKKETKVVEIAIDKKGEPLLSYEYFNAAYCGLVDAYYDMMAEFSEEIVG